MTEPDTDGAASEQIEGSPDGGQRRRLLRLGWIIGAYPKAYMAVELSVVLLSEDEVYAEPE